MPSEHLNGFTAKTPTHHDTDEETTTYPMVSVKWKDAESQGGPTWEDSQDMLEFAKRPLVIVHTVGQLIHSDEEKIAITDTVSGDQMGGVTKIPRMWIMEMTELEPMSDSDQTIFSISDEDQGDPHRSVG